MSGLGLSGLGLSGLALSRRWYERVVAPLLNGRPHAAALLGGGSEVLGYDDGVSPDHDFGLRVQLFLPPGESAQDELAGQPAEFDGFPTAFAGSDRVDGPAHHHVEVTTAAEFFSTRLGRGSGGRHGPRRLAARSHPGAGDAHRG